MWSVPLIEADAAQYAQENGIEIAEPASKAQDRRQ